MGEIRESLTSLPLLTSLAQASDSFKVTPFNIPSYDVDMGHFLNFSVEFVLRFSKIRIQTGQALSNVELNTKNPKSVQ